MHASEFKISPEAEQTIAQAAENVREKIKNALRDIGRGAISGAKLPGYGNLWLYRAGRFRIFYRKENDLLQVEVVLMNAPVGPLSTAKGAA